MKEVKEVGKARGREREGEEGCRGWRAEETVKDSLSKRERKQKALCWGQQDSTL